MCYPKPGPRCSPHALKKLRESQAKFIQENSYDAYAEMRKAQEQYDLTPQGQKDIAEQMAKEPDFEKKYALQQRLEHAVESRRLALEAINSEDKGDVRTPEEEGKNKTDLPPLPTTSIPDSPLGPLNLDDRYNGGVEYDYDDYEHTDPNCLGGYDCRDRQYVGLRVSKVDERGYLSGALGVKEEEVPETWVKRLKESDFAEYVSVETYQGYYGEEAEIVVDSQAKSLVRELYYSQPNANDYTNTLRYAREEGVDTTGLTPQEAVHKTYDPKTVSPAARAAVKKSNVLKQENVRLDRINFNKKKMEEAGSYDFSNRESSRYDGGLVVETAPGEFYLLSGYERFKAVQNKGRVNWKFQVLTREKKEQPPRIVVRAARAGKGVTR